MTKYTGSYQKIFKAALATTVATGAFVVAAPLATHANESVSVVFKDLDQKAHYYAPVLDLSSRGIVKGYEDGTYKPGNAVTRGQAAKILALSLGLDTVNVVNPGFKDVKETDANYGAIAALAQAGIINGYDDKTFKPNNNLKRSQMAKIITLGFELKEESLTDLRFTDINSTDAYAGYVQALLTNNITTGNTPTTFGPNALVTRGQIASFVVRSEAAVSVKDPVEVTSTIKAITNSSVELADGTFKLDSNLKTIINPANLTALQGATVKVTAQDGLISKISSIEIPAGTTTDAVVLDGQGATLTGNLLVNRDNVTVKGLKIEGNLEIGNNVKNSFTSDGITVNGKTLITGDKVGQQETGKVYKAVAFALPTVAEETATKQPNITFANSTMGTIEVSKQDVIIESKGTTSVAAFTLSANVHLKADAGVTISQVTIAAGAEAVVIDAAVSNLTIDTTSALKLGGTGDLGTVTINSGGEVSFETTGKIDKIEITSKDSKLTFGADTKIGILVLPEGVEAKDLIANFDSIKGNIGQIEGAEKPEVKPGTPGDVSTGDGNTGGTVTPPTTTPSITGNQLLNDTIKSQIGAANDAANGKVGVSLSGNTINVNIIDSNGTLGDFNSAAGPIFNAFKDKTVVSSAEMSIVIRGQEIPISKSDIDLGEDLQTLINKAFASVGVDQSESLSKLEGRQVSIKVKGSIENKDFDTSYSFQF